MAAKKKTTKKGSKGGGALKLRLIKSLIGANQHQRRVVSGLGLRRMHQTIERQDTPEIRGMVRKVPHLVEIVE